MKLHQPTREELDRRDARAALLAHVATCRRCMILGFAPRFTATYCVRAWPLVRAWHAASCRTAPP